MAAAAGSSDQHERSCSHIPAFSARHPMIPKLYVMAWRQDMENQRLLMKNAAQAGIPVVPLEESLCLSGRERLCHSQDSPQRSSSSSSSSSSTSALLRQTGGTAHNSSHLSRYNSSVVTTRQLYQN
ncbi:sperm-associated microtubule inner protein 10-like [Halichoeres trimaculatus]|uniref:sperm-associated microtubule inner protein 10-like n=1 Tax=Halichoeres trimaculatus TaxID=147232 RepID=UPI003D9E23B7